ncbi:MAG: NAD(P)H-hydrate dehydratase [Pseudomonadota bacterium]|nr:NAD(P)H-hydrate dehydratase [Pseudomonadota bacterium]
MSRWPRQLYRAAQVRALDRYAAEALRISEYELMCRAGAAAFDALQSRWPDARRVLICCGRGNNGGDGYVVGRLARRAGMDVTMVALAPVSALQGAAAQAARGFVEAGGHVHVLDDTRIIETWRGDLIVDALLGTGLERSVEGLWRDVIEAINRHPAARFALDIPSGLSADSGAMMGSAVRAEATITFIALKPGLVTGNGVALCGDVAFENLGAPEAVYAALAPYAERLVYEDLCSLLPARRPDSHKGDFGHVLVVGGGRGMSGAARMAGEAALRIGAGLVTVATWPDHASTLNLGRPELMVQPMAQASDLSSALAKASVLAIGPGLGTCEWAQGLFDAALGFSGPMVVDADGLNLLARQPVQRDSWILTPHPGEAARLLGCTPSDVQGDRYGAAEEIQSRYGGVVVLKGAGSVVRDASTIRVCDAGNPGMASGGMGDVLTGVIVGLSAQHLAPLHAAGMGVLLHAMAGDRAAENRGERGLLASDLLPCLRGLVNGRESENWG